jgi:hypothetical protein
LLTLHSAIASRISRRQSVSSSTSRIVIGRSLLPINIEPFACVTNDGDSG